MQAAIRARGHPERSSNKIAARDVARDIANFHEDFGDDLFPAILSNLQLFEDVVEANVSGDDLVFARSIRRAISKNIRGSQKIAQELRQATRNHAGTEVERALEDKLNSYGIALSNCQLAINKYVA